MYNYDPWLQSIIKDSVSALILKANERLYNTQYFLLFYCDNLLPMQHIVMTKVNYNDKTFDNFIMEYQFSVVFLSRK